MFLGALKNLENLLQSGEEEDANKFVESLDIAWACKSVKVDLSALAKDDLSTSLLPEDISSKPVGNPVALHTTGNGNCLYNSASVILCGNELRSHPLRILVAKELYFNAEFYAKSRRKILGSHIQFYFLLPCREMVTEYSQLVVVALMQ